VLTIFASFHDSIHPAAKRVTPGRTNSLLSIHRPGVGHVFGLSEKEARAQGIAYRLFKKNSDGKPVFRASHPVKKTRGFLKALVELNGDPHFLGFTRFLESAPAEIIDVRADREWGRGGCRTTAACATRFLTHPDPWLRG